jgi:hypothetical protein
MAKRVTGNREPPPARALAPVAHAKELAVEVPSASPAVVEATPETPPSAAPVVAAVVTPAPAPAPAEVAAVVAPKPAAVEPPPPPAPEEPKASAPAKDEAPAANAAPTPPAELTPKKVPAHVLEKSLLSRVHPKLPPAFLVQHPGEQLRVVAIVCVGTDGRVDRARTKLVSAAPGTEEAVLSALAQWRYQASEVPLCGPVQLQIDVGK